MFSLNVEDQLTVAVGAWLCIVSLYCFCLMSHFSSRNPVFLMRTKQPYSLLHFALLKHFNHCECFYLMVDC